MIFQRPRKLTALQIALIPVAIPLLLVGLVPFAVLVGVDAVRSRLRHGFWG
jgi:hypothetical protein